jgi:hypothetical protein
MSGILAHPNLNYLWAFDWNVQNKFSDIQKKLEGLDVDLYVSMKIEGDVTYTADLDLNKIPKYWIDRMIVVDKCGNHIPNHAREVLSQPTCYQGYTEAGTCGLCGKYSEVEDESTRLPHDFGAYVTNADGSNLDAEYKEQLDAYAEAFRELTGENATALIYHIDV